MLPHVVAKHFMEMLMMTKNAPYFSDQFRKPYFEGEAEGRAEGLLEGMARSLLSLMATKRLEVTPDVRAKVTSCTDPAQLDQWTQRLLTATTVEEIFAP